MYLNLGKRIVTGELSCISRNGPVSPQMQLYQRDKIKTAP
jgi:hypothetical protein